MRAPVMRRRVLGGLPPAVAVVAVAVVVVEARVVETGMQPAPIMRTQTLLDVVLTANAAG